MRTFFVLFWFFFLTSLKPSVECDEEGLILIIVLIQSRVVAGKQVRAKKGCVRQALDRGFEPLPANLFPLWSRFPGRLASKAPPTGYVTLLCWLTAFGCSCEPKVGR